MKKINSERVSERASAWKFIVIGEPGSPLALTLSSRNSNSNSNCALATATVGAVNKRANKLAETRDNIPANIRETNGIDCESLIEIIIAPISRIITEVQVSITKSV